MLTYRCVGKVVWSEYGVHIHTHEHEVLFVSHCVFFVMRYGGFSDDSEIGVLQKNLASFYACKKLCP